MTESKYSREQIFDKIQKLMEMANRPDTNEHLAASAAAKAQELMQKWAIEESELEAATKGAAAVKYSVERVPQLISKVWHWEKWLGGQVAGAFFCHHVYSERAHEMCFCGREQDAKMAAFVFSQLRTTLDKLARQAFQKHAHDYKQTYGKSVYERSNAQAYRGKWLTSWMDGAVSVVGERLKAQNQKFTESNSMALVLVETRKDEAKAFAHTQFTGLYTPKSRITVFTEAQKLGREAGKNVAINKGLEASDPNKLKG